MNIKLFLKKIMVLFFVSTVILPVLRAEEELPVEIDIEILNEKMSYEEALKKVEQEMKEYRLNEQHVKAVRNAYRKMVNEGIPVNRAYEVSGEAIRNKHMIKELGTHQHMLMIKTELAKEELRRHALKSGEDISSVIDILEELIRKGVSVENAFNLIRNAMDEGAGADHFRQNFNAYSLQEMNQAGTTIHIRNEDDSQSQHMEIVDEEENGPDNKNKKQ